MPRIDGTSSHALDAFFSPASIAIIGASRDAMGSYQATRDRISGDLFDITDRIASQQWNDAEISELLIRLSASMQSEVELLTSFSAAVAS